MAQSPIRELGLARFFFADTRVAWLWLVVRLYLGYEWLVAGWDKLHNGAWAGYSAGSALTGFVQGALGKTGGVHPDVQWWYAWFLSHAVLPHVMVWSNAVAWGEALVGVGLIVGCLTGLAAFFGIMMNINYLFAGTVSVNPEWFILGLFLVLAWRTAGYWGIDRFILPVPHLNATPKPGWS